MQHLRHSPQLGAPEQTSTNPTIGSEIRQAQFYYLDAKLLLISGKALHLYSYSLQRTPTHDAARAPELRHKYRLQHRWPMPRAHAATCFAAANSFLSPVVLIAGSDRSLAAVDLGTGSTVLDLNDAHERPIHSLRLAEGSAFGDAPSATRDLFVTSALDGVVKLWDLRTASCVRRFDAHTNHVHPIGASLSPCLRYLCCGSEDKSAYVYDARSGAVIERLRHPDTISDAAFSPLHPQLATSALDGRIRSSQIGRRTPSRDNSDVITVPDADLHRQHFDADGCAVGSGRGERTPRPAAPTIRMVVVWSSWSRAAIAGRRHRRPPRAVGGPARARVYRENAFRPRPGDRRAVVRRARSVYAWGMGGSRHRRRKLRVVCPYGCAAAARPGRDTRRCRMQV